MLRGGVSNATPLSGPPGDLNKYCQTYLLCYPGAGVKKRTSYVLHPKIKKTPRYGFTCCYCGCKGCFLVMDENTTEEKVVKRIGGPKNPKDIQEARILRLYRRQLEGLPALQLVLDHANKEQVGRATAFRDWKAVQVLNREDFEREREDMASRIFSMRSRLYNSAVKRGQMQTAANVLDSLARMVGCDQVEESSTLPEIHVKIERPE